MASWPEVENIRSQNRHELILRGKDISSRIEKNGIHPDVFSCAGLNFLQITETCLNSIPPKICGLQNLTSLILHTNNISELSSDIGELTKLKVLDASNNKINKVTDALAKLSSLTTLNLSFNEIHEVPSLSKNIWLSIADFSFNQIDDMSEFCRPELAHLSELHLKRNKIKEIPVNINELTALKLLDLSENVIKEVPGELGDISKLKDINLQVNPLNDKRLAKLIVQNKPKPILDYIRERCVRKSNGTNNNKGQERKSKGRMKLNSEEAESEQESLTESSYRLFVSKCDDICKIKRTDMVQNVRPQIIACIIKNVSLTTESIKKFIQLQSKLHDGICDKRKSATIATHDLELTKSRTFTYTAMNPDELRIVPLTRTKEFTARELLTLLHSEAEKIRKEKKRNTCTGVYKFLRLAEGNQMYACVLNSENTVISFPPITNSEISKISVNTKNILVEVTSSIGQGICKKVLDTLLKEMLLAGIGVTSDINGNHSLNIEQVRIEDVSGNLIAIYPSNVDLKFDDGSVNVIRA